ncbi:peptide ABC transporter substrate-binding protein [Pelagibius litoralis]|uniref:Peptide ABC transporter substrate-binding protein n=1 Tax=Pelagibius litoralis TaxID=374515 RepID=A0A967K9Y1_9PROT|nr:peptide ABC transporter substrate-binding protein [Pelagibius litoralis]NIA70167.1 peptide ABC transporter substrate-binding protein [Pelagibius litoralis]
MRKLLLAIIFAVTGTTAAAGEELRIGLSQYPTTLHPNIDPSVAKSYVRSMTRRPMTVYDHEWQLICMLCVELPSIEAGTAVPEPLPDGVEGAGDGRGIALTYRIQPQATWGDGTPVTTADVVFTWKVGRHEQAGIGNAELYRRMLSIDVIDEKTFVVHADRVSFEYAAINDFKLLPAHIDGPVFEAAPDDYKNRTAFDNDPTNPGLYFGPYRITEAIPGSRITLERNDTWWGKKPAFDRIVLLTIEKTTALEANLLSGNIDMISGELGLSLDQALAFEKRHGDDYQIVYEPGLLYEHIDLMLENPILQDKTLRQALIYAIDREAISERLFAGRQPVAHSGVSPLDWVHDPEIKTYSYDPKKAGELLDAAGWSDIRNGIRHNAAGEPLRLEFMTTAGNRIRELVQQVLQSQWRQVGIDMRVRNEPPRVFFGQTVHHRRFTGLAMFAWGKGPEHIPRTTLHSEEIPSEENGWSGQNYTGFRNAEMDALIEAINLELDRPKRKAMWSRIQQIYAEEVPVISLYWRANAYVMPKWLRGVRPTGQMASSSLWVEDWTVEGR